MTFVFNFETKSVILAGLFVCLTAVGAWIRIPFPIVPLTLQVFFVLLSGMCLGPKWGAMSQAVYIGMGLIGLPVFAGASGPHILFSPTCGYLVGFILASYVTGKVSSGEAKFFRFLGSSLLGLLAIYLCGIIGLYLNLNFVIGKEVSFIGTIKIGVLPFLAADALKAAAAAILASRVAPQLLNMRARAGLKTGT